MAGNPNPNQSGLKPFKPGADKRRNTKGRPPKLPELDKLLDKVLGEEKDDITAMEAILKAVRGKAIKGDIRAAEVIFERAYGKAKQTIDGSVISYNVELTKEEAKKIAKDLEDEV